MLNLRLTINPGSVINQTISEMLHVARTLDCRVEVEFNQVVLRVRPDSKAEDILEQYRKKRLEFSNND